MDFVYQTIIFSKKIKDFSELHNFEVIFVAVGFKFVLDAKKIGSFFISFNLSLYPAPINHTLSHQTSHRTYMCIIIDCDPSAQFEFFSICE